MKQSGWRKAVKVAVDRAAAAAGMVALAPLLAAVAVGIRATMGTPVVYKAKRGGYCGQVFTLYKFRTMTDERDAAGRLLPDEQRLHGFGRFLRRSSLDELPQLYNILRGDMSFVGPRPALFNQDDLVALRTERGVHELVPGLTGWAQINGRDELPIPQKVEFDAYYVRHRSFALDVIIIARTALQALTGQGVSH